MSEPVILYEETDAQLADAAENTWVYAKNFAIYIIKTDEGVVVDIYAKGCEDCDSLGSTYAFDDEAKEIQAEYDEKND
jgi:thiol-disulfide isomerase/thioredoxin